MRLGRSTRELELAALQTERGRGDQSIKTFPHGFRDLGCVLVFANQFSPIFFKTMFWVGVTYYVPLEGGGSGHGATSSASHQTLLVLN